MQFPSIDIQGSVLSADLLGTIRTEQAEHQSGKSFHPDYTNSKLKEEISLAWQDAKGQWAIFQSKLKRVREGETATTETRNFWILPLLSNLGYNLNYSREAEVLAGKSFPISYKDATNQFPVHVCGFNESLDKRPESKQLRVSPHALLQEYLNYSEQLYGVVTNGRQLRLLRDASRLTRLSYVEFNLEKMMEEDLYSDFVILYRLLHVSRMRAATSGSDQAIMELYHQQSLAAGATIREKLGDAVKQVILDLANGVVNHPDNIAFRQLIADNLELLKNGKPARFDNDEFYRQLLRVVYRMLFLFVIEERNLVYAESRQPEVKRLSNIYFRYYSLMRLRKLARHLPPPDASRHNDLWLSLLSTFALFEHQHTGSKMGIMALQGDLFAYNAIVATHYDMHQLHLSNQAVLKMLRMLSYFENDQRVLVAVNYGGLDVEEFGSVYEGLLELKIKIDTRPGSDELICDFDRSNERSKSGSHYTPEELVQPLIKHSLDYLIEDRVKPYQEKKASKEQTVKALLSLKICDVACGSGHILLSAARRVAMEIARIQTDEEQPNPLATRKALREVIRHCIYGVDKNPLAIELCKIAFWLEAHNPGEPLNFLDHHIKCGDAIVGLAHKEELQKPIATEAFNSLSSFTDEEKKVAATLRKQNDLEKMGVAELDFHARVEEPIEDMAKLFAAFEALPENTPEEIADKEKAYKKLTSGANWWRLKTLADIQVAQFFLPKTPASKDRLTTTATYQQYLKGQKSMQGDLRVSDSITVANEKRFFHWFLEFPEVFQKGGFDCILGNPPFLGGQKLSGSFGDTFLECIKYEFHPIGAVDIVTYFFRRVFNLIKAGGFQSLISTNTIAQGKTREDGLDYIVNNGGSINFAIKSIKWIGTAALEVSLITITKQNWFGKCYLGNIEVKRITPYLDDTENATPPFPLLCNQGKSFIGHYLLGTGFIVDADLANQWINSDPQNTDILSRIIRGEDLTEIVDYNDLNWVINFDERDLDKSKKYSLPFDHLQSTVFPERQTKDAIKYPRMSLEWWKFWMNRKEYVSTKKRYEYQLLIPRVSKHVTFQLFSSSYETNDSVVSLFLEKAAQTVINSSLHEIWARRYGTTLETRLRYSPSEVFDTFPFPNTDGDSKRLIEINKCFSDHRRSIMLNAQIGITKLYNYFNCKNLTVVKDVLLKDKEFEKKYGKESAQLNKHLAKNQGTCGFNEAVEGVLKLREQHVEMDNAVLEAYGWRDIQLNHDFYEVDYLPENDRTRYTIHPDARKEVLKRLLELNHKIRKDEEDQGLWGGKGSTGKPTKPKGGGKTGGGKAKDENQSELF